MPLDPKQQPPYYTPGTNGLGTPSTRYVTLLNQSSTNNPTQTIQTNNTPHTITNLTRNNIGIYSATVSPALDITKTTILCNNGLIATHDVHVRIATSTSIEITTSVSGTPTDGLLTNITMILEIFQ